MCRPPPARRFFRIIDSFKESDRAQYQCGPFVYRYEGGGKLVSQVALRVGIFPLLVAQTIGIFPGSRKHLWSHNFPMAYGRQQCDLAAIRYNCDPRWIYFSAIAFCKQPANNVGTGDISNKDGWFKNSDKFITVGGQIVGDSVWLLQTRLD